MILSWTLDQHGGQAKGSWALNNSEWTHTQAKSLTKGLGLHLQQLAHELPEKHDLHEPDRLLTSLDPYDHLRRLVRLCYVHIKRNIQECNVSAEVRLLMRSLLCVTHQDWDRTIYRIQQEGGKAGTSEYDALMLLITYAGTCLTFLWDWVQDKIRSKFAFAAMCWERSYIPLSIWRAGESNSNLIESVHADVNREGVRCTLIGGVKKGQAFDVMKMRTLKVWIIMYMNMIHVNWPEFFVSSQTFEETGNRPSYNSGSLSENASKRIKRKCTSTFKSVHEKCQ